MCRVTYGLTLTVGYGITDSYSQIDKNTAKTPEKVRLTLLTFSCRWWDVPDTGNTVSGTFESIVAAGFL